MANQVALDGVDRCSAHAGLPVFGEPGPLPHHTAHPAPPMLRGPYPPLSESSANLAHRRISISCAAGSRALFVTAFSFGHSLFLHPFNHLNLGSSKRSPRNGPYPGTFMKLTDWRSFHTLPYGGLNRSPF
jgi:hypothetical protein